MIHIGIHLIYILKISVFYMSQLIKYLVMLSSIFQVNSLHLLYSLMYYLVLLVLHCLYSVESLLLLLGKLKKTHLKMKKMVLNILNSEKKDSLHSILDHHSHKIIHYLLNILPNPEIFPNE